MTGLEKYISTNLEAFDCESIPEGSKGRFMDKIGKARQKNRIKVICFAFSGIAAGLALFLTVFAEPDISKDLERHYTRLAEKENEILMVVEREYPEEKDVIENTLRAITSDPIPLEEQLPDEMSDKEKSRILNDYYDLKYSALETLMVQVCQK